jgi:hypothetical protein
VGQLAGRLLFEDDSAAVGGQQNGVWRLKMLGPRGSISRRFPGNGQAPQKKILLWGL